MSNREKHAIAPDSLDDLCRLLAKLHGEAQGCVEMLSDFGDPDDAQRLAYEEGRCRAYDVALFWASELRRVQTR